MIPRSPVVPIKGAKPPICFGPDTIPQETGSCRRLIHADGASQKEHNAASGSAMSILNVNLCDLVSLRQTAVSISDKICFSALVILAYQMLGSVIECEPESKIGGLSRSC